jgi:hypothetical protein
MNGMHFFFCSDASKVRREMACLLSLLELQVSEKQLEVPLLTIFTATTLFQKMVTAVA